MKFHDLAKVRSKIRWAVIAGIQMEFVLDVFFLKLAVESRSTGLKTKIVVPPAVEIYG